MPFLITFFLRYTFTAWRKRISCDRPGFIALLPSFFFPAVMLDRGNARPESSSSIPSLHASLDLTSIPTETIPYSPADKESFDARKGSTDSNSDSGSV